MPKGVDYLEPGTPAWEWRAHRHKHNGLKGHVSMMHQQLMDVIQASSTTAQTKQIANSLLGLVDDLAESLNTRVDPPYLTNPPTHPTPTQK